MEPTKHHRQLAQDTLAAANAYMAYMRMPQPIPESLAPGWKQEWVQSCYCGKPWNARCQYLAAEYARMEAETGHPCLFSERGYLLVGHGHMTHSVLVRY